MVASRRANRGPSAADENRRALVAAAIQVFGERGIDAPLSTVAKTAGVGQGCLYRHFPDRMSLALAAFEDNVTDLEELAAADGSTLDDLLALITEQTIASVAFVEIVTAKSADDDRLERVANRVSTALEDAIRKARQSGTITRDATTGDVLLAIGMMAAYVAKTPPDKRRNTAAACWRLLRDALC